MRGDFRDYRSSAKNPHSPHLYPSGSRLLNIVTVVFIFYILLSIDKNMTNLQKNASSLYPCILSKEFQKGECPIYSKMSFKGNLLPKVILMFNNSICRALSSQS